jgi:hypothetical protein
MLLHLDWLLEEIGLVITRQSTCERGMTMSRREKKEHAEKISSRNPQRYVISESELRSYVGSLSIVDIGAAAARLQIVADLTSGAFEERIDNLGNSDLALIKQIADEDTSAQYQQLMGAIITGIAQGRHGINSAHLTASRVVELAFRCTREYFAALHCYRRNLRVGMLDRPFRSTPLHRRFSAAGHQ